MRREPDASPIYCSDCGAELLPQTYPTYPFGSTGLLCFACAVRRGGSFDARRDRWNTAPDIRDLARQARD